MVSWPQPRVDIRSWSVAGQMAVPGSVPRVLEISDSSGPLPHSPQDMSTVEPAAYRSLQRQYSRAWALGRGRSAHARASLARRTGRVPHMARATTWPGRRERGHGMVRHSLIAWCMGAACHAPASCCRPVPPSKKRRSVPVALASKCPSPDVLCPRLYWLIK